MTKELFDLIKTAAKDIECDITWMTDYSGRNSYGVTTFAVVCQGWPEFSMLAVVALSNHKRAVNLAEEIGSLRSDTMGKNGTVIY